MIFLFVVTLCSMLLAAIMSVVAWRLARDERRRSAARVAVLAADIHVSPGVPPATASSVALSADLFASAQPEQATTRWVTVGSIGVLVFCVVLALAAGLSSVRSSARPAAPAAAPLELTALDHEREGDRLVIHGAVRNPPSGPEVARLTAVVFLFNRDGGFLASERAAVGGSTFGPGMEAPFTVTATSAGDVARYRISFRTEDRIVPHVDTRGKR